MLTHPTPLQRISFWIGWRLRGIFALALLAGCASPDEVRPFRYDESYTERFADPGKVDQKCYSPNGHHDSGGRQSWNDSFCGCLDWSTKTVWIARRIECNLDQVRAHEDCHLRTGPSKKARALCHSKFPPNAVFRDIPRT